ncbi:MAG: hypothetical protein LBG04_03750, partial [Holosporaceae bacterium]|nr:hypothetical protein [Holosporaceae bacterium]
AIADLRLRTISDRNSERTIAEENAMARGLKKGMKRGLKEGIEKGRKEGKEEGIAEIKKKTALNAISMGLSIKQIEKLTNLSAKEIELLQNNKINRRKP